jgi:probable rRNA maturation factor
VTTPSRSTGARRDGGVERKRYVGPWRIDISVRPRVRSPIPFAEIARVATAALDAAHAQRPASLGVILSDDRELAALNEAHMGEHGPTDVLSFPLFPPDAFGAGARTFEPFVLPPGRRLHLGDIVISIERAALQAREGRGGQTGDTRWSPADELRLLITHGVLHVCGWDHASPSEEAGMRALERRLLERQWSG